jgi:NAD(P)H-dependent FMN reductase
MIQIIVGTNRHGSNSAILAETVRKKFESFGKEAEIMNLNEVSWGELDHHLYGKDSVPPSMKSMVKKVNESEGIYLVIPEYNGSFPGVLKTFIDYWDYPSSFEKRPVCFTGLGGMFGGLRPVEHLQQVFGYRNAFIFPERIFLQNVWNILGADGILSDSVADGLLDQQIEGFGKFIDGLKSVGLHCKAL